MAYEDCVIVRMLDKVRPREWGVSSLPVMAADYEPSPKYGHISGRVGSLVVVQEGRTDDFSEESKQHLSFVVEIFDPYTESWE